MASPEISEEDVKAVSETLRSGTLALGPAARDFEERMAARVGVRHAIAVNSGTAALHLIVRSLGLGPGDEVLVPSFTFAASVNAVLFDGATPVFVDIEPDTYTLDPDRLAEKIGHRSRAILGVDVFGHPAEWNGILDLAADHGLAVIDDSCEALGAEYRGRPVGSLGDAAAFAFYPNKQITTGEGGMVVTNDDDIARACRSLRNQGRNDMGAWLEHERLGYNYRMDEMSAALGGTQLARLDALLAARERVARSYMDRLKGVDFLRPQIVRPHVRMSWFVFVVTLEDGLDRDGVIARLAEAGVPARGYFPPVHLQPYVRERFGYRGGELPVTEAVARRTLALPFHGRMTREDVDFVVEALEGAAGRGRRRESPTRAVGAPLPAGGG